MHIYGTGPLDKRKFFMTRGRIPPIKSSSIKFYPRSTNRNCGRLPAPVGSVLACRVTTRHSVPRFESILLGCENLEHKRGPALALSGKAVNPSHAPLQRGLKRLNAPPPPCYRSAFRLAMFRGLPQILGPGQLGSSSGHIIIAQSSLCIG